MALRVLSKVVSTDDKLILFNSFGCAKFDDSPRVIYEMMLQDERFKDMKLVWAFMDPTKHPEVARSIKADSLLFFITALKARCWITNSSMQRGIDFKGTNTFSYNTWHGTPIKKMGAALYPDIDNSIINNCDVILTQSEYETKTMAEAWKLPVSRFKQFGYPRNDDLVNVTEERKKSIKEELNIPHDKKVILYAPTFRDYVVEKNVFSIKIPINYSYWEEKLSDEWVFVLRAHYEIGNRIALPQNNMWFDYSDYQPLNDLIIASDILISDYSSIFFDYAITNQPMLGYVYDFDEYNEKRGMYFDIRKELSCYEKDTDMVDAIASIDLKKEKEKCELFRKKYVSEYGHAGQKSIDYIYDSIKETRKY